MKMDYSRIITADQKRATAAAETKARLEAAVYGHLDAVARSRDERSGDTLASYATSTNAEWASEAQAFVAWRDAVWSKADAEIAKLVSGKRQPITTEQLIAELPASPWG